MFKCVTYIIKYFHGMHYFPTDIVRGMIHVALES